jgi:serine/threonine protein kinase
MIKIFDHVGSWSFILGILTSLQGLNIVHFIFKIGHYLKFNTFRISKELGIGHTLIFNYRRTETNRNYYRYPPESIEYGRFSEKSDIWSYGVTLFEIFSYGLDPILPGLATNENDADTDNIKTKEMMELLNKGVRLPCPESCPQSVYTQLMLPCWELNPQKRPSFRSLLGDIMKVENNLF